MKFFKELDNLPILDLWTPLQNMLANDTLVWGKNNQICINTIPPHIDDYKLGTGSLTQDWDNAVITVDKNGIEKYDVPLLKKPRKEKHFTELCSQFVGTEFEIVYNALKSNYNIGRVRIMKMSPKYCMTWHTDSTPRIHFPIKTQPHCFMLIEDEVKHLELEKWYETETTKFHTALNASVEDRIHLVATIL